MATNYITLLYISGKILWIVYIFGCKLKNSHWLQYGGLWEPWQGRILADERIDHIILKFKVYLFGAPRRSRTFVTLVNNNQQLYQLSYRGINHEGGNPHIIYGWDAFGQFCRIFHHHHVSHASTALFYGAVCNALFHLSPFLLIGGDSISSEKFLKRLAIHKKSSRLSLPLVAYLW